MTVEKPKKGFHRKAIRGAVVYPSRSTTAFKTELDDADIRGVCRAFGIDEAELRKQLQATLSSLRSCCKATIRSWAGF